MFLYVYISIYLCITIHILCVFILLYIRKRIKTHNSFKITNIYLTFKSFVNEKLNFTFDSRIQITR